MVAMTSGKTPAWSSRATRSFRTPNPRRRADTSTVASRATANGSRSTLQNRTMANAGKTTNSPWAKLIVLEVCHRRTNPVAHIA